MPGIPSYGGDQLAGGSPPLNPLHAFLASGFQQALPVMGSTATIGGVLVDIIISAIDEKISMEMEGYLSDADFIGVCSSAAFTSPPLENAPVTQNGDNYLVRAVKSDPSSYVLMMKKVSI